MKLVSSFEAACLFNCELFALCLQVDLRKFLLICREYLLWGWHQRLVDLPMFQRTLKEKRFTPCKLVLS